MPNASSSHYTHHANANRRQPPRTPSGPEDSYYRLLGVPLTADQKQIRSAYHAAMKQAHPDRVLPEQRDAAEERAKLINRAYATLSDPVQRRVYDQSIKAQEVKDQLMRRYASNGYGAPVNSEWHHDPLARRMKRDLSAAEKMENRKTDRSAMLSLLLVFVSATAVVILFVLLLALGTWLVTLFG